MIDKNRVAFDIRILMFGWEYFVQQDLGQKQKLIFLITHVLPKELTKNTSRPDIDFQKNTVCWQIEFKPCFLTGDFVNKILLSVWSQSECKLWAKSTFKFIVISTCGWNSFSYVVNFDCRFNAKFVVYLRSNVWSGSSIFV